MYDIEELFLDTMTGFQPCYCAKCKELYGDIPKTEKDKNWLDYVKWYRDCYNRFFEKTVNEMYKAYPHVAVTFNWNWSYRNPAAPPEHTGRLAGDSVAHGKVASLTTRFYSGTGKPFDYMSGRFQHGLGEWNNNTQETLKFTAATTVANGGSFYLIDRQLPDGSLEDRSYKIVKEVFDFIQERREILTETETVDEIAVLFSRSYLVGDKEQFFPDRDIKRERLRTWENVACMFMENSIHYNAISDDVLKQRADDFQLIIVPEIEFMSKDVENALIAYVKNGGNLLFVQSPNEEGVCPEIFKYAGVEDSGWQEFDYSYIPNPDEKDAILLPCRSRKVKSTEAKTLIPFVSPQGKPGEKFGHGYAPYGEKTDLAVASVKPLGKGKILYLSAPVFSTWWMWPSHYINNLIISLINELFPERLVKVESKAHFELSVRRKDKDLIVHLVNQNGKEHLGGWYFFPTIEYMPIIRNTRIKIKNSKTAGKIELIPENIELEAQQEGDYLSVEIPETEFMSSLRIKNYFA